MAGISEASRAIEQKSIVLRTSPRLGYAKAMPRDLYQIASRDNCDSTNTIPGPLPLSSSIARPLGVVDLKKGIMDKHDTLNAFLWRIELYIQPKNLPVACVAQW